jgi:hypothetical protein
VKLQGKQSPKRSSAAKQEEAKESCGTDQLCAGMESESKAAFTLRALVSYTKPKKNGISLID